MPDVHGLPRRFATLLFAGLISALPLASHADSTWSALRALQKDGARVSASVRNLTGSSVHERLNSQLRLSPASITKVVVAATALEVWPADKSFETRVMINGRVRDGKIDGDLILNGDGDSTLDHRDLWALAGQVRAAGVRSVGGDVVAAPPFGPLGCDNMDRCAALIRSDSTYDVPLSGLAVDFGAWCVEVQPTTTGQPAQLRACGGAQLPIPVEGTINTGGAKSKENYWLSRHTKEGLDTLRVGGTVGPGDRREVLRSMSDPALGAAMLLRQMLIELGVKLEGSARVHYGPPVQADSTIAKVNGLALREQLGRMLRYSNNYVADLLTLNIAAARAPQPPRQLGEAAGVLANQMVRDAPPGTKPPILYSGSGLTPENAVSADEMVALLERQYRSSATFPAFYGGLVVPGQAPFAFLRGGSREWRQRVALKTGTMNDPVSVCAVAGYLRRRDGGWMAFTVMVNGSEKRKHVPLYKAMEAIRKDIDALLDRY